MRKLETKIINKITWKLWHYSISDDTFAHLIKRRFWVFMSKVFKVGLCIQCGKLTKQKHRFTDDGETSYLDYCHDICFEYLQERL